MYPIALEGQLSLAQTTRCEPFNLDVPIKVPDYYITNHIIGNVLPNLN
jgi:hypothetical protein